MADHSPMPCQAILIVALVVAHLTGAVACRALEASPADDAADSEQASAAADVTSGADLPNVDSATSTKASAAPRVWGLDLLPRWLCLRVGYCAKPEPCIACGYRGCGVCYQAKPLPCPPPCAATTCGDYRRKPEPCVIPAAPCPDCPCQESP